MAETICMISVGHSVKDDRIYFKEALSLQKAGYKIKLLFTVPKDGYARDMSGKILNPNRETEFNIGEIRAYTIRKNESLSEKIFQKFFAASFQKRFIAKGIKIKADVYHCHEPESLYLGRKICDKVNGSRLVLDAHESWIKRGIKTAYIRESLISKIDYLISANDLTRGYLTSLNHNIKSEVIFNSALFKFPPSARKTGNETMRIVHEGSLKFNRGLKLMMECALILKKRDFKFEWHFLGHIPDSEKAYIDAFITKNDLLNSVQLRGNFPYEELPEALKGFDVGIIASTAEPNNYLAGPPNKLFNYIAAGYPIIATDLPESTKWIEKYEVGKIVREYSPEAFAEAIIDVCSSDFSEIYFQNIGRYQDEFLWDKQEKKLISFYGNYLRG